MRPLRLDLKNFTAFRGEHHLDLTPFDVFAVVGPTGSGKSSLLDAMTYALFGYVERVGKQVGQLISQGQPRMSVSLEFDVDGDRYRVVRSTASRGASTIRLDRAVGDGWQSYGEGADRVRDATEIIKQLIGLDYRAFTRSVLLPQGTFAEFLTGDAAERRQILVDLLGLTLFPRLGERARGIATEAATRADADSAHVEREYADATAAALAEARAAAKHAAARELALASAAAKVDAAAQTWAEAERSVRDLQSCAAEARTLSERAEEAEAAVRTLSDNATVAAARLAEHRTQAAAAEKLAERASRDRATAESRWGREADLTAAREQAHSLQRLRGAVASARERADADAALIATRSADVDAAERAAAASVSAVAKARSARELAERDREAARHADHVAAAAAGLRVGDACPICAHPLATAPRRTSSVAAELRKAERALAQADRMLAAAERAAAKDERDRDRAVAASDAAATEAERGAAEVGRAQAELKAATARLAKAFRGPLPPDPLAAIEERLASLAQLTVAHEDAAERLDACRETALIAERALAAVSGEVAVHVAGLRAQPVAALIDRARRLGVTVAASRRPAFDPPEASGDAAKPANAVRVADAAGRFAGALAELALSLEEAGAKRSAAETSLLAEAEAAVGSLLPSPGSLTGLAADVAEERRRAAADAATSAADAERIATRIEARSDLERGIAALRSRAVTFKALANELRADRIVAFLQDEALHVLAAAGSERLARLSDGRYRLSCEDGDFFVIDTWNAQERRSVRTLSGGETFLASLSLALALSEQVRSLSVAERARLDSLFLDEGFGTLDPDSLEVVVEAIDQLGGDGRLVGLITHVRDLAERFARLEVEKSPRGSRLIVGD